MLCIATEEGLHFLRVHSCALMLNICSEYVCIAYRTGPSLMQCMKLEEDICTREGPA